MTDFLQIVEEWLRATVKDEMAKALEADREKAKPEKMLTREEVCAMLRCSKPTLWQRTKAGEIEAIHIGRRVVYKESEIKKYLERG